MKFSLLNVIEQTGLLVSGYWVQNHVGSLASAREAARTTETVNGNKIDVAVVVELSSTTLLAWMSILKAFRHSLQRCLNIWSITGLDRSTIPRQISIKKTYGLYLYCTC